MKFAQRLAVVTGGAAGIGRSISAALLTRGAFVAIADVDEQTGRKAELELGHLIAPERVCFVRCDVRNSAELEGVFKHAIAHFERQHVDILINNAGVTENAQRLFGNSPDDIAHWKRVIDINLTAVIDGCRIAVQYMKQGGVIINVASMAGLPQSLRVNPNGPVDGVAPVYTASKHGVVGFSRAIALHFAPRGIRVNVICPAYVDTAMGRLAVENSKLIAGMVKQQGLLSVDMVTEGMLQLIEDDSKIGAVMRVTPQMGIDYEVYSKGRSRPAPTDQIPPKPPSKL
jgi:15-hydroxyprostaglandin dehydrogenase (NAD)